MLFVLFYCARVQVCVNLLCKYCKWKDALHITLALESFWTVTYKCMNVIALDIAYI